MSRRSLYRQSGRYTSTPYIPETDERVVSWSREWVTPALPVDAATSSVSQSATPAPGAANDTFANGKSQASFSVKMWVHTDSKIPQDGDDDDYLVFEDPVQEIAPAVSQQSQEGGLSAADIRGAVGGEAIPGISASSDYSKAKEEEKEDESAPAPVEPPVANGETEGSEKAPDVEATAAASEDTEMTDAA